jgi:hypothetical protein
MITLDRLQQIIPADQALANKALSVALQQITGITNLTLPTFSVAVTKVETTKDLPLVSALPQAVPPNVANYYTSTLAVGNGANGSVMITDILGLAAGWLGTDGYLETVQIFSTMDLSYLTTIYNTMYHALNGDYGPTESGPLVIPGGLPCAGTYVGTYYDIPNPTPPPPSFTGYDPTAISLALACLYGSLSTEIANLEAKYPDQTSQLNSLWNGMAAQIPRERSLQATVKLNYSNLTANDKNSIYGFVFSLPSYGVQNEEGGMGWFVENTVDLTNLTGQSIIGSLRQGLNQAALNNAGIYDNSNIPATPNPPPPTAPLLPSTYTAAEAANLVAK